MNEIHSSLSNLIVLSLQTCKAKNNEEVVRLQNACGTHSQTKALWYLLVRLKDCPWVFSDAL